MALVFSRVTQALTEDHGGGSWWSFLIAAALLEYGVPGAAWRAWQCMLLRTRSGLEAERAVYLIETPVESRAGRVIGPDLTLGQRSKTARWWSSWRRTPSDCNARRSARG